MAGRFHAHWCPGINCRRTLTCTCDYYIPPGEDRFCISCIQGLEYLRTWLHPHVKIQWVPQVVLANGQTFDDCWMVDRLEECNCPDAEFDEGHPEHWERIGGPHLTFEQAICAAKAQIEWIGYPPQWRLMMIPNTKGCSE